MRGFTDPERERRKKMAKKLSKVQHAGNAFAGLMGRKLIREGPKYGIKPIPESVLKPVVRTTLATIVVLFGTDALKGNDGQAFVADLLTFLIPDKAKRDTLALIITEIIEEMVKVQDVFGDDDEENKEIARNIITGKFEEHGMGDKDKKAEKSAKPADMTALQVVGELEAAQQSAFWAIVTIGESFSFWVTKPRSSAAARPPVSVRIRSRL